MQLPLKTPILDAIAIGDLRLDIIKLVGADGTILSVSSAIESIGYDITEVVGRRLVDFLHPEDHDSAVGAFQRVIGQGAAGPLTLRCRTIDGSWRTLDVSLINRLEDPKVRAVVVLTRDVTDKVIAESRIAELTANITLMANNGWSTVQQERRRIAQELHDDIGQLLFLQGLFLEMARTSATHDLAISHVLEALAVHQNVYKSLRVVTQSLNNFHFANGGLPRELTQLMDGFRSVTKIAIHLRVDSRLTSINLDVALTSFRIIQEAVNNALRHSNATNLWVTVEHHTSHIVASVIDDGFGFDVDAAIRQGGRGQHFGIRNMRERAALLQGHLDVVSPVGTRGTRISFKIPLLPSQG